MENEQRVSQLTFGEKAVNTKFNVSGDSNVDKVKSAFASILNIINDYKGEKIKEKIVENTKFNLSWFQNVFFTQAFNAVIVAQMCVVKFLTWKDDE